MHLLSSSYDTRAHHSHTHDYSFSPSKNGCAYPADGAGPSIGSQHSSRHILFTISEMLNAVLSDPTKAVPDHRCP